MKKPGGKGGEAEGVEAKAVVHVVDPDKLVRILRRGTQLTMLGVGALPLAAMALFLGAPRLGWALVFLGTPFALAGLGLQFRGQALGEPGATAIEYGASGIRVRVAGREEELPWERVHGAMPEGSFGPWPGTRLLYLDGPGPLVPDILTAPPHVIADEIDKLRWLIGPGADRRAALLPAVDQARNRPGGEVHPNDLPKLAHVTAETVYWVTGFQPPWLYVRHGQDSIRVLPSQAIPIAIRIHAPGDRVRLPGGAEAEVLEAGYDLQRGEARYRLRGGAREESAWVPASDLDEELVVEAGLLQPKG